MWADGIHAACEQLPAFGRLASECRGEPMAAGTAVETLMAELKPEVPQDPGERPTEKLRRQLATAGERASQAVEELRESIEGLGLAPGTCFLDARGRDRLRAKEPAHEDPQACDAGELAVQGVYGASY